MKAEIKREIKIRGYDVSVISYDDHCRIDLTKLPKGNCDLYPLIIEYLEQEGFLLPMSIHDISL